jgi:hypothetical protein
MSSFDAEVLASQLAQLGRDLQDEVKHLAMLEHAAVDSESTYRHTQVNLQKVLDEGYLSVKGNVEERKAQARLKAEAQQLDLEDAYREWGITKADVRIQQASLSALHRRCEIGRSLLSREKALISLAGVGEV